MTDHHSSPEEQERRRQWFKRYVGQLENRSVIKAAREGVMYQCPCCRHKTLEERGGFEVCPVCFWEDDGQDDQDADTVRGGPNGALSLTQARENYRAYGASCRDVLSYVRKPLPEELNSGTAPPPGD